MYNKFIRDFETFYGNIVADEKNAKIIHELPPKYKFRLMHKHNRILAEFFKFKKGEHICKIGAIETSLTKFAKNPEKTEVMKMSKFLKDPS